VERNRRDQTDALPPPSIFTNSDDADPQKRTGPDNARSRPVASRPYHATEEKCTDPPARLASKNEHGPGPFGGPGQGPIAWSYFDADDLAVRAMCYHQLGKPKEAAICLGMIREMLGKDGGSDEQRALLREAEILIRGKVPR
jgi:hypothetical protein